MLKYLGFVFRIGWTVISSYGWIRKYARHVEKYSMEEKYQRMQKLIVKVSKGIRLEYHIKGIENVPQGNESFIMIPNHQSMLDSFVLFPFVNSPLSFVAKKETKKYPFVGKIVKLLEGVFLDRDDLRQSLKMMRHITGTLKENTHSWVIFPEGHRTKNDDFSMNEMKPGSFKMALDSGKTIVPICMYGTFRGLSSKYKNKYNPIQITFLKPITKEEYGNMKTIELASLVQSRIEEELNILRENDKLLMEEIADRKKRKKK